MHNPTEQEMIMVIIEQCTSLDGFLVKLHSLNEFDEPLYNELYTALQQYSKVVSTREHVHRAVAGCLLALEQELLIKQEEVYGRLKSKQAIVQQAFREVIPIP